MHDHSGHAFTAHLSRTLARRGLDVVHGYSTQFESPHGQLTLRAGDAGSLRFAGLTADAPFDKYSPLRRTRYEISYARAWQRLLEQRPADLVLACNVPLFTMTRMRRWFARHGVPWILWHQDLYSRAMSDEAGRVLPGILAAAAARTFTRLERDLVASADATVAIGEEFLEQYRKWGVSPRNVRVQPNWTPLDEIVPGDRSNGWAAEHHLPEGTLRLIYAGTLGRKHNPRLLVDLVDGLRDRGVAVTLVVASAGPAAAELADATRDREDVRVVPFVAAERFAQALSAADVCVALLEPAAAQFSVPSKVLSYLAAGRPALALVPSSNPAAAEVRRAGGFAAEPTSAGVSDAVRWVAELAADNRRLAAAGARARAHAEREYDIESIVARFAALFEVVADGRGVRSGRTQTVGARE